METTYEDPGEMYQQFSYDHEFFLQPNNNDDHANQLDMTAYRGAWTAHGCDTQGFPYANYPFSTRSPFVDTTYLDSFEPAVTPPVSFIVPSQTQLVPTPPLSTGPAETGLSVFEPERQSQPDITPLAPEKSGAGPGGPGSRFAGPYGTLRLDATEGKGPGPAPGNPASIQTSPAGGGRTARAARAAHVAAALDQGPSTETGSEKKGGGRSDSSSDEEDPATLKARNNHSAIERRYRDNLNGKINQLRRILQTTEANSPLMRSDDTRPPDPGRRVRKCEIMAKALQYVHRSQTESRHMRGEIRRLRDQVSSLEKMIKCEDCTLLQNMRTVDF